MKTNLFFVVLLATITLQAQNSTLFVGTYTSGESEGVYTFDFNSKTGELSNKKLIAKEENPSYIAFTKDKQFLYVINEVNNFNTQESGSVSTYKFSPKTGYQKINTVATNGAHPCHISLNTSETKLAISNYSGGTVSLHDINKEGILQPAFQILDQNIGGEKAHAHMAQFVNNQLFTADLGRNFIAEYSENTGANYYKSNEYKMMKKAGPRHFRLTKDASFMYVINELNSTISVLKKSTSGYTRIQNVRTIAQGFDKDSFCADIQISADEQFVYGSNRGENSIVVFKRDINTGRLQKIQTVSVNGNWPRSFIMDPTGSFLLTANERSNSISVHAIDKATGKLTYKHRIEMPAPVCLLF